ncbi:hypothetical protein GCM10025876_39560 [Demequina litorisediminis]|uniref:Uncharacterized protein n=1 Tax=Demequina litorisediminis TaxID=1849022 RepID=A0ABQ6IIK2_9MICO|nr:hypothetical protein GCM10025876_00570 [Demequina litorisediminis]GMA37752.1 hypothetical protein GCM10025876_39560 [Demequina litorisediminis]
MANVVGETDDATVTPEVTSAETDATATSASATPEPTASASPEATTDASTGPVYGTTDPSSFEWLTADVQADFAALDCLDAENYSGRSMGDPEAGYVACGSADIVKYAMGPVEPVRR